MQAPVATDPTCSGSAATTGLPSLCSLKIRDARAAPTWMNYTKASES